jgi:hypothetical protein
VAFFNKTKKKITSTKNLYFVGVAGPCVVTHSNFMLENFRKIVPS